MNTPYKLKIIPLAFKGADENTFNEGQSKLINKLDEHMLSFVKSDADVLYFLTGGSESFALNHLSKEKSQLLIAFGENNAYASAIEVQAFANSNGYNTMLVCMDDKQSENILLNFYKSINALSAIQGKKLGLIGEVSDWLIASDIKPEILLNKLGIEFKQIEWSSIESFSTKNSNPQFIKKYNDTQADKSKRASQVYEQIKEVIKKNELDAVTVECFPMVNHENITACLALSHFNDNSFPAGCEGDIVSITGMMLLKELTGQIPWMANLAGLKESRALFAHCTAPTTLLSDYSIQTHFETNKATAIQGYFKNDLVTIFRLNSLLTEAFLTTGNIVDRPTLPFACRTQVMVEMDENAAGKLKETPLGNHHLILPGDFTGLIKMLLKILGIKN